MSQGFVELDGSPAAARRLEGWLDAGPSQMGPVVAVHRVPAASRPVGLLLAGVGCLTAVLLLGAVAGLLLAGAAPFVVVGVLVLAGMVGLALAGVVVLAGRRGPGREVAVHAHGLVLGGRAIPWATMDPGRFVWATEPRAARQVVTLNRRRALAGGEVLLLNGTDGRTGVDDWEGLGTVYDPLPRAPRLDSPFVWWCLGPRDVGALVRDVESAMVADGYPVRGLAGRLRAHRRPAEPGSGDEVFPRRAPQDPVLWPG